MIKKYETVSYETIAGVVKYYNEIYNKNNEKIADIIIVVNEDEGTVEVEVKQTKTSGSVA